MQNQINHNLHNTNNRNIALVDDQMCTPQKGIASFLQNSIFVPSTVQPQKDI